VSDDESKKALETAAAMEPHSATTLEPDDIQVERSVARRSVLGLIGTSVVGAVATACGPRVPRARYYGRSGITDADPNDSAGRGRGTVYVQQQQPVYVQQQPVYVQQPQPVYVQQPQPVVVVQQPQTGITDGDSGAYADPAGGGRGNAPRQTGLTDGDAGAYADPAGGGRGTYRTGWRGNVTDNDSGAYADPAGRGRGRSGLTDSDSGPYADPAGRGRGGIRVMRPATGITDRDSGDPAGGGRGYSGLNDSDPSDPAGRGRFGR
jgi:hypothetical protein